MISHAMDDPYSPAKADIRNFLKKSAAARRALSELGPNDPKANMRMAESLITITAEQFMKKWNFDPISFRPMAPGRYVWTPVKTKKMSSQTTTTPTALSATTSLPSSSSSSSAATPFASLAKETIASALEERLSGHHLSNDAIDFSSASTTHKTTTTTLVSPVLRTPKKSSPSSSGRTSTTPKTKQCKITAYGRQRKRLHSTSKTEEGIEIEVTTPRKKRLATVSPSKLKESLASLSSSSILPMDVFGSAEGDEGDAAGLKLREWNEASARIEKNK
ncbi:uncharacterized protein LOC135208826 [Macrobrachium nipponense]|uniref:uncharacterized protein LOC135208826 n=1 Tax=Macrobrachium nipponense TaxID=159736 RepID=UPI0030C8CBCE